MGWSELKPFYDYKLSFYEGIEVPLMYVENDNVIEEEIIIELERAKCYEDHIYHSDNPISENVSWDGYQRLTKLTHRHEVCYGE